MMSASTSKPGETTVFTSTKIALAAALILGAASAARANDIDQSASSAEAARMHGNPLPWWWNSSEEGRGSLAYQAIEPSHAKSQPDPKGRAFKH
jgi:hypothetical protein